MNSKRKRLKKKSRKASSYYRELDALARQRVVVERDNNTCVRCGKSAPQYKIDWSHVYSRENRAIRWHPDNSKALCFKCHEWWAANPVDSGEWFQRTFPDRYLRLQTLKNQAAPPIAVQYEQVLEQLTGDN